jgi:hypothetical protein
LAVDEVMLRDICETDVAAIKKNLQSQEDIEATHIAFEPSYAQAAWHTYREKAASPNNDDMYLDVFGAITLDRRSWIYWEHRFPNETLEVQRMTVASDYVDLKRRDESIVDLLEFAVGKALKAGLKHLIIWNPDDAVQLGAAEFAKRHDNEVDIVFEERADSLPQLRWKADVNVSTTWELNEYYAWC